MLDSGAKVHDNDHHVPPSIATPLEECSASLVPIPEEEYSSSFDTCGPGNMASSADLSCGGPREVDQTVRLRRYSKPLYS